ncbi:MAG: hypothetical protein GY835_09765 [bacterium]|nr:hypothetical protein [bacterium]
MQRDETGWEQRGKKGQPAILPHVEAFLYPSPEVPVADRYVLSYRMTNDTRQRLLTNRQSSFMLTQKEAITCFPVDFRAVELYLFRSNIAVLVVELRLCGLVRQQRRNGNVAWERPVTVQDLIDFNSGWRRAREGRSRFTLKLREQDLELEGLVSTLLESLGPADVVWQPFQEAPGLGFTYVLFSQPPYSTVDGLEYAALKRPLFWLRRYLKTAHSPAPSDIELEGNVEVIQTYENIYCGLSRNGWAILVGDNGEPFLREQSLDHVRSGYFPLFLLVLHQQLAAVRFARLLADLGFLHRSDRPRRSAICHEIERARDWILDFTLRCSFGNVSTSQARANLYRSWQGILGVSQLLDEVKRKIEELDDYLHRIQTDRQTFVMNLLTFVFLPFSLLAALLGVRIEELSGEGPSLFDPALGLTVLGFSGFYALAVWWLWRRSR